MYGSNGWGSNGKVSYCFLGDMLENTGLQGSTLSDHRMATGFGPFELPTHGLPHYVLTLHFMHVQKVFTR